MQPETTTAISGIQIRPGRRIPGLDEDVRRGLLQPPRSLPPKYFYDARGSELFDRICDTPEYYPTRTEAALLREHSGEIVMQTRPDEIIELGSGTSGKTRHLFNACEDHNHVCSYAPFDVCAPMLQESATLISNDYQWLQVTPLVGDYSAGLDNLPAGKGSRLFVFLGGTIGNFNRDEARSFIREIKSTMQPGEHLLMGVDRIKDTEVLNAAYNDAHGVTAEFNLNVLNVINRELNANFDPSRFRHRAGFNTGARQMEMHLESTCDQSISIEAIDATLDMSEGERILTEISCKYEYDEFSSLLQDCELELLNHYEPPNRYYSLFLARST
jgi:L-histidine N-alpha-methyltransferase